MRKTLGSSSVLSSLLLLAFSSSLSATPPPSFGVDQVSTAVVTAWDVEAADPTMTWGTLALYRHQTSAGTFLGALHLPQGALILSIELEACDQTGTGEVAAALFRGSPGATSAEVVTVETGDAETPGCTTVAADLPIPETVENDAHRYIVGIHNTTFDGLTSFAAVRVRYKLQVSPAPANATFGDVPANDPAFQFVEALVASGITAGCGGGNYCPDAAVTRRQMAVFLAKALGLQWPDGPAF
jgi:hypothetical protein